MGKTYQTVIHWFRRDLRLTDNTALHAARDMGENVIPVYILSDWKEDHHWTGPGRQKFLCGCLESLSKNIDNIGSRLIFRQGDAVAQLEKLIKETEAEAVFLNRDPDAYGKETEKRLLETCRQIGIEMVSFKDTSLHESSEVLTQNGDPYRVYSPYSRTWMDQDKPDPVPALRSFPKSKTLEKLDSLSLPELSTWKLDSPDIDMIKPGEKAARDRLKKAIDSVLTGYKDNRNIPSLNATSHLGPDLRYGTISPREVWAKSQKLLNEAKSKSDRENIFTFQKQLAWREFFMAILDHYPEVLETDFNPQWRELKWDSPGKKFENWKKGETGFPIVDAGIRQLISTGYMHNRVRMIVAMFLTKDLHIHWRLGEAFFLRHLLDGEIANNNGGWQWSAGTGADAAPYFRIQNPWTQTERYDPDGEYIKKWVPELKNVDPKNFRKAPKDSEPIADDYPLPIVDHSAEREETLERFKKHKEENS